jgi:hypothetical protein
VADDPFVVVAAGRSPFRVTDLIHLHRMLQEIQSQYLADEADVRESENVK